MHLQMENKRFIPFNYTELYLLTRVASFMVFMQQESQLTSYQIYSVK